MKEEEEEGTGKKRMKKSILSVWESGRTGEHTYGTGILV
jgi:hypothetical protein